MNQFHDCITNFIFAETTLSQADAILIPGASQPQLMERAAALYHDGLAPYILPSGGRNPKLSTTEWAFLQSIGVENGVPEASILKEDRAQHTFQNAEFSLNVLRDTGIEPKKVIVVCKAYHARRALLTYQTVFPKETIFYVSPVTDRTGITKHNWFSTRIGISFVTKEVEKIGRYFEPFLLKQLK